MKAFCIKALSTILLLPAVLLGVASAMAGEIRREEAVSSALGGKLPYAVYLPDGYDGSRARYPVLYLLHGAGGDAAEWTEAVKIQKIADQAIRDGIIPPAVIVMPECRGCWWIDSPRANMETALVADLLPAIAARFRTIEGREGRAVAGFSAGGYGAIRFGLKFPDKFAAVAAFSPAIYSDLPPLQSLARSQLPFKTSGAFNAALWKAKNYPSLLDGYTRQAKRVGMYLVSGDHDKLGIAYETALLFKSMFDLQGEATELRVVDGGHSSDVVARAMPDALVFMFRFLQKPTTVTAGTHTSAVTAVVH